MSVDVKIPAVGESITSGLISVWHKQNGEAVAAGEALLTLETDKVSTELTAEKAGVLRIKVPAGQEVKIGDVVGSIEEGAAAPATKPAASPPAPKATTPAPKPAPPEPVSAPAAPAPAAKAEPAPTAEPPSSPAPLPTTSEPALLSKALSEASTAPSPEPAPSETKEGRTTRKRMSPIRRKIAAQLVMAQQTAAILTTFNECDMSGILALRSQMQESFTAEHGVKLGFMSFFVKAAVSALKAVPAINSRLEGEDLIQNHYYDIGVAVGTERGLVVPVIRDADQKSFADIEKDIAAYAGKARENKIKIEDLQGGVFTISNGGIYGSLLSTPILNPPQSGILGMHKMQERPIALKGEVVIRPMMYLALSYDHRVVDGKEAVTFLIRIKECIETPARLMLDL
ncbi:MAG TPA: 2-oxoglutarate dehydrogenase complex dihydrolipoyllysine-residue succinyltransferase [Chthoniobacteraceae bacterium]|jgi:2-oxoglutarate dehydrogenase E2 component (dihydrolipoamide succinyltransferase)